MTKRKSKPEPVLKPYLAEVKGIEISASGRFQISDKIIDSIRATLGKDYVTSPGSRDKTHRFSIQAYSFVQVDADRAALEFVRIGHCKDRLFHFNYSLRDGPKSDSKGKSLIPGYDDDVQRILAHLSASRAKRDLRVKFELPPGASNRSNELLAGNIGDLPVAGLKLRISGEADSKETAHLAIDWENPMSVKSSVTLKIKLPITKMWPMALVREFKALEPALRSFGVSHGIKT